VARVALLCRDLLFGSKIQGGLAAHDVVVCTTVDEALSARADLLVVDLASGDFEPSTVHSPGTPILAFYSHVDHEMRLRAEEAGFDMVVPRSRMAREMGALVDRMVAA
jgi:hypothetical protein